MDFTKLYGNPAHPAYLADPFVFQHEGIFYAVGTGLQSVSPENGRIFPMLRSDDFVTWHSAGSALVPGDPSLGGDYWAPEIAWVGDTFFLYYSVGKADQGHQLRVATSKNPIGPYSDVGAPVLDPKSCPFAIDANPFQDVNGRWYLLYSRDFLDGTRPGTSIVIAPLQDMVRIPEEFSVVARANHDWQRYQSSRSIYGGVYDWHTLEGPCMVLHEGRYHCIYSGGNWQNESYGLDYVHSESIMGAYVDDNDGTGPRILKTIPKKVIGPGHNSVVVGPNGFTEYLAYHAWDTSKVARRLCFDVLDWVGGKPHCDGPTWEPKVVDW